MAYSHWPALAAAVFLAAAAPARAEPPAAGVPACPSAAESPDPAALIRRMEQLLEGRSSVAVMTMSITTPTWSRTLRLKVWTKGRDYALIRVLAGSPRETGMMTLKREKQLWNYLPQAGRVMKLPSGMLGDAWLGSDFTNDDLVRGNSIVDDFDARLAGRATVAGRDAWLVTLTPRPTAAVVWGRIETAVDRATCVPLRELFYDEDGTIARTMTFGEIRSLGWRRFPARMTVQAADAAHATSMHYDEIAFDVEVPEDTFSLRRLQQGR
jgi:outer membrane lipoprotein-sorting protein